MTVFDKKSLSERGICTKYIAPSIIEKAGWNRDAQVREEVTFTKGRVIVRGRMTARGEKKRADYILYHKPNLPIAVVKAKDNCHSVEDGLHQAIDYAETLDAPFAYSSNGDGFIEHEIKSWLDEELQKESRGRGPEVYKFYIERWKRSWENWGREFFCDLFATFTLGPAYVWSHFHLCATRGGNPFGLPLLTTSTHPPDDARMQAMLDALCLIGFDEEAVAIENRWNNLIKLLGAKPEPEYNRCFPKSVFNLLLDKNLKGVKAMNCRVAQPTTNDLVHSTLNEAWRSFWHNPSDYFRQETRLISTLKSSFS